MMDMIKHYEDSSPDWDRHLCEEINLRFFKLALIKGEIWGADEGCGCCQGYGKLDKEEIEEQIVLMEAATKWLRAKIEKP